MKIEDKIHMARKRRKTKKKPSVNNFKIYSFSILAILLVSFLYVFFIPNVNIKTDQCYFYIQANSSPSAVYDSLKSKKLLKTNFDFWIAKEILKFEKPTEGLYQFNKGWGNFRIVQCLKAGNDNPWFTLEIPAFRSRTKTIKKICKQADINFKEFDQLLKDSTLLSEELGLNTESIHCIFLPGNYKLYKKQDGKKLLMDVFNEYNLFWNDERSDAAKKIKCSPEDVIKLASIVYAETKNEAEMPVIAGIYLNRLKKKMLLQADPTLVYANNNQLMKRVYFKHTETTSPYNTYKYKGLPPGPIGPAPQVAIDAVLNSKEHNYIYFCAKEDQSGCHYFSEDFEEHKKYASRYRNMLNKKRIK